ncbi:Gfo/Idh/MocA family oxidoreductase [Streptomyces iranensis]|uniref:Dehydrogenase n=1 Tax=Streptomyces iranensis TaxID=576784 RepID=A0A061A6L1_9ACTN|nr:Gfo/Idh/MocA family oxidoreductase [Streptomyces iranensis]MBP2067692.1 putative dehydrogenase [Streptomyces iranensis]CDR17999.1 oxidoreductase [Streptomyces iranensis]
MTIRTAIIGFGTAGRVFHAPFVAADPHYALSAVVTRDEGRRAEAVARYPSARVLPDVDALLTLAADEDSFVVLRHDSGVHSYLWMNGLAAQVGPRFHVLGSRGAYTKYGLDPQLDPQEAALKAGAAPTDPSFGGEPEPAWRLLGIDGAARPVPTLAGSYAQFYARLADALLSGGPLPVDPREAVRVIELVERIHQRSVVQCGPAARPTA